MSNDKSDISDMPDVMFIARDEMSNDHYLAGDNREEGDTEYVRRSLVDEYIAASQAVIVAALSEIPQSALSAGDGAGIKHRVEVNKRYSKAIAAIKGKQ